MQHVHFFNTAVFGFAVNTVVGDLKIGAVIDLKELLCRGSKPVNSDFIAEDFGCDNVGGGQNVDTSDISHRGQSFDVELEEKVIGEAADNVLVVEVHNLDVSRHERIGLFIQHKNVFVIEKSRRFFGAEVEDANFLKFFALFGKGKASASVHEDFDICKRVEFLHGGLFNPLKQFCNQRIFPFLKGEGMNVSAHKCTRRRVAFRKHEGFDFLHNN